MRGELGAVVADDHARTTPAFGDPVELAHDPRAGERGVDDQAETLAGEVVDEGQHPEAPAAGERVHHEVQRPALVRTLRHRHRRPRAECPFAAATLAHGQAAPRVEPEQLLVIDPDPCRANRSLQATIAEPTTLCDAKALSRARNGHRPAAGTHSDRSSAPCRPACRPAAASSPSLRSPRSRRVSASRASEVFCQHLAQRRDVQHRLRQQLLQLGFSSSSAFRRFGVRDSPCRHISTAICRTLRR